MKRGSANDTHSQDGSAAKKRKEGESREVLLVKTAAAKFRLSVDSKNTMSFKVKYESSFFEVCKHSITFVVSKIRITGSPLPAMGTA